MLNQVNDMLCRIKNGQKGYKYKICLHKNINKQCIQILQILEKEGFISGFIINKNLNFVYVILKYTYDGFPAIKKIFNISTSGRKFYNKLNSLWTVNNGFNILILSTTKGLMTLDEARNYNVGGKLEFIIS